MFGRKSKKELLVFVRLIGRKINSGENSKIKNINYQLGEGDNFKIFGVNAPTHLEICQSICSAPLIALASLGDQTQMGSFLFLPCRPRKPRQRGWHNGGRIPLTVLPTNLV
jgi:hypothetical protein